MKVKNIIKIGYARVSTKGQNLARQKEILTKDHCKPIFFDKVSGKTTNRPSLHKMFRYIRDTPKKDNKVIVEIVALDRLGRNSEDDSHLIRKIKAYHASLDIKNFQMARPPRRRPNEDKNTFLQRVNTYHLLFRLLVAVLEYQTETERREIKERQKQGIENAKKLGKYKGRKPEFKLSDPKTLKVLYLFHSPKCTLTHVKLAHKNHMSISELYHLVHQYKGLHQGKLPTQSDILKSIN